MRISQRSEWLATSSANKPLLIAKGVRERVIKDTEISLEEGVVVAKDI